MKIKNIDKDEKYCSKRNWNQEELQPKKEDGAQIETLKKHHKNWRWEYSKKPKWIRTYGNKDKKDFT